MASEEHRTADRLAVGDVILFGSVLPTRHEVTGVEVRRGLYFISTRLADHPSLTFPARRGVRKGASFAVERRNHDPEEEFDLIYERALAASRGARNRPSIRSRVARIKKLALPYECPHGRRIVLVDGVHVRNTHDSDFVQGGNGYRYRFVPKDELWVDATIPIPEWPFVILHECYETEKMAGGWSYERAHDAAKRIENKARRLNPPR